MTKPLHVPCHGMMADVHLSMKLAVSAHVTKAGNSQYTALTLSFLCDWPAG
jgi:hypothetical protein